MSEPPLRLDALRGACRQVGPMLPICPIDHPQFIFLALFQADSFGVGLMQVYRLYALDEGGALHLPREFQAADDASAIAHADALCDDGRQMELWARRRKVHCWGFPDCPSQCDGTRAH